MPLLIYDKASGRISSWINDPIPPGMIERHEELGIGALLVDLSSTKIIGDRVINAAPFPIQISAGRIKADGQDKAIISGVPPGTSVMITHDDDQFSSQSVVDDGVIEITSPTPDVYTLHLSADGYVYQTIRIEAA